MFPLFLDLTYLPIGLVGNGARAVARLRQLRSFEAANFTVFSDAPSEELMREAGKALVKRLPEKKDFARRPEGAQATEGSQVSSANSFGPRSQGDAIKFLMIADLPPDIAHRLAEEARSAGVLVNVEDDPAYCDFYFPAIARRGDLVFAVGTKGKSPAVATAAREYLEAAFGKEWAAWLEEIAEHRLGWKAAGDDAATLSRKTRELIRARRMEPLAGFLAESRYESDREISLSAPRRALRPSLST